MTHYPGSLIKEIGADESERRSRANAARKGPLRRNRLRTAKIKTLPSRAGFSDTLYFYPGF